MRVLIADDDRDIVMLLRMAFETQGHEVLSSYDGIETLQLLAFEPIDAVVLDVMMPRLDGLTVLAEVRARRETADLPVVVLTAVRELFDRHQTSYRTRHTHFVAKPFDAFSLVELVEQMLEEDSAEI
ncbi:MAG: response regulator [Actinomycetota bacterium]